MYTAIPVCLAIITNLENHLKEQFLIFHFSKRLDWHFICVILDGIGWRRQQCLTGGWIKRVPFSISTFVSSGPMVLSLLENQDNLFRENEAKQYKASILLLKKVATSYFSENMFCLEWARLKIHIIVKHLKCQAGLGSILVFRKQTSHISWSCLVLLTGDGIL